LVHSKIKEYLYLKINRLFVISTLTGGVGEGGGGGGRFSCNCFNNLNVSPSQTSIGVCP
jgi:hypothetical protein